MPYIKHSDRNLINVRGHKPSNAGQLNYVITELIKEYWHGNGANYQAINDILGALEGAKIEFYRRVAADYENSKKEANGDVY